MNFLNKFLTVFISLLYLCSPAFAAFDIDTSVDDDIRKKYNTNKIEEDLLPPLPNNLKNDVPLKSNENFSKPIISSPPLKEVREPLKTKTQGQHITLGKGTKFTVRSTSGISDRMSVGTKIYFKPLKQIKTRFFTLPENTRFVGVVVDSHTPQLSGNGGLLVIKVENVVINGRSQEINAKITKANYKKIFFNNIKGKRTYWKNLAKSTKPGRNFYNKMWSKTKKLANDSVTVIFSPFTLFAGVVVGGVNFIGSPVFALFSEGGSINIPANSPFELKILEEVVIYN